ncbi:hypothetical protein [Alterisphingorhabdus coralli]|uniref:Lipoprotein n=1 Tax=Alterisphingorhabdus coralli TaxID=3071408 RepID=A0AA97HZV7_9SPHN|nr:hypothetical protein [Parasphingorhabdus sp. SCSIO 66989]WOE75154.1 hypothetical protein RB602_00090 [Parasphingorhabdus sp. SCSIO 66989]
MKATQPFTLLMVPLLLSACSTTSATAIAESPPTDNFGTPFADTIPADVRRFIVRRQGCDHFRGEPPYDEQRAEFLAARIEETCTGTDAELAGLRRKYRDDGAIITALSDFEDSIELP